jgi:lipopolysaccharide export system permease protein
MTRIGRYILRNLLIATTFSALAVTMTIWVTQSLKLIDLVINAGAPFIVFIWMMALTVPTFLGIILPIALVGAILFSYNKLIMDSELVVMRAVGMGPWRLATPGLLLGLMVMSVVYFLNLVGSPYANRELVRLQYAVRHEFATVLIREGAFNDVSDGLTVYLRKRLDNGELQGLMVHDLRQRGKETTLLAERGAMVDTAGGIRVIMLDGLRQELEFATGKLSELYFDRYLVDFQLFDDKPNERMPDARERSMRELLDPPPGLAKDPEALRQFAAELHMRLSSPLLTLAFTLIGLAALLSGDYNRRGQAKRIAVASVLVIGLQGASLGLTALASKTLIAIPAMYLLYLAPMVPSVWLLSRR